MLEQKELEQWAELERRLVLNGNDGADIYEAEELARRLCEKYGVDYVGLQILLPKTWEHGLFNKDGNYGPHPLVGSFTEQGLMLGCRDMTKEEQLRELFPSQASDWQRWRAWLGKVNQHELNWVDAWSSLWFD